MKNTTLFIITLVIIALVVGFAFENSIAGKNVAGNNYNQASNGEVQIVRLSVSGSQYVLSPNEVRKGIPVRIEADMTNMPGCSKSIVIPGFGVSKTVSNSDNIIEFTPDKTGVFNIMCSMNMYRGTFTVLDSDGSTSNYVESKPASQGTCGMSSGSCGCGG